MSLGQAAESVSAASFAALCTCSSALRCASFARTVRETRSNGILDGLSRAGRDHPLDAPAKVVRLNAGSVIAKGAKRGVFAPIFVRPLVKALVITPMVTPVAGLGCR